MVPFLVGGLLLIELHSEPVMPVTSRKQLEEPACSLASSLPLLMGELESSFSVFVNDICESWVWNHTPNLSTQELRMDAEFKVVFPSTIRLDRN